MGAFLLKVERVAGKVVGTSTPKSPVRRRGRTGHLRSGAVFAMVGLLIAPMVLATPALAQDVGPTDVAGLESAFGVSNIRSDYVVVIDTSGSMEQGADPLFPKVRDAYASLVDAIPDGDRLTLVTFDETVLVRPNVQIDAATRASARELPPAEGRYTDIGAALNSAVEALDQPDAASIQTVIFITDGIAQPRPGSPFEPVGSPAWQAARDRAAGIEARRTVDVRALGLTDAGKQGADLAAQVFGTPEIVQVPTDQLRDYLTTEVRNARRKVLEKAIQDEIDNGQIDAAVTSDGQLGDEVRAKVELTNRLPHLGVAVDLEGVTARAFDGTALRSSIVGGSRTVDLGPGESATFEVLVKPGVVGPPFFALPPEGREELDITLDFAQTANATPVQLLRDELGITTDVKVGDVDQFTVSRTTGKSWTRFLLEVLVAVLVCLALFRLWWRFVRKPRLQGALLLVGGYDGAPELQLKGKRMVIDASEFGRAGTTRVKLYTRRGKPTRVYADRIGSDGSFDRKHGVRWSPVEAGSALGLVITYRLDGEAGTRFRWRPGEGEE